MLKIDKKDKKLLYYLSLNARASHTSLSRKIALSKNAVKYRIERLQKMGVIEYFASVINIGALKLGTFTVLLKFNEDIYENEEIVNYFKNHPYANWVASLSGQWDIFAEFIMRDITHLRKIISDLTLFLGGKINKFQVFLSEDVLKVEHLVKDFYKDIEVEEVPFKERTAAKYDIDTVDRKILHLLAKESALHYLEIARRLKLTLDVVRYRMKNLQEKQILIKTFAEVATWKLGYTGYLYTIQLSNVSHVKIEEIKKSIKVNDHVTYAFFDPLSSSLVFVCSFREAEGIDQLSRTLRKNFGDIIEEEAYFIIKEDILFNLFPKGLLEGD